MYALALVALSGGAMSCGIRAECDCGEVLFESSQKPFLQIICHCGDCREATGSDFSQLAFFKEKHTVITGELTALNYVAASQNKTKREMCSGCRSVLFDRSEGFPGLIGVFVQRLQSSFQGAVDCHVWVGSKVENAVIPAGAQQHPKGIS